jgi:hypothetical protein
MTAQNTPVSQAVSAGLSAAQPSAKVREEDSRTRAVRRAAELRDHAGDGLEDGEDKYYIDPRIIPDGWSYEWKAFTVLGKENPSYQVSLARTGWEAVPRSRHPELMPSNYKGETIERDGMILMERPQEITDQAKSRDLKRARLQVRGKEEQLGLAPAGQFDRDNKGNSMVNIKKTYEHVPIPDK